MDTSLVMDIAVESLRVTVLVAAPILAAALMSGLLVGILQAATSMVMTLAIILFGEWQIAVLADYFETIFERVRTITL